MPSSIPAPPRASVERAPCRWTLWVFAGVRKAEDGESLRRASSVRLTPVFIDVTDEQSIAPAAEEVSREVGDAGLLNNAGVAIPGPLE